MIYDQSRQPTSSSSILTRFNSAYSVLVATVPQPLESLDDNENFFYS